MKRWIASLLGLCIFLAIVAAGLLFGLGYWLSPQSVLSHADAIVAISGGETNARAAEAVQLYHNGWSNHLIFSGAASDPTSPSNARAMANLALKTGVPESAIELDEAALNTDQNASGVEAIVQKDHYTSIILVTSPYHQRRAMITFQRKLGSGVTIINHSSPDQTWRRSRWWATPFSINLTLSELQKTAYVMWFEK